MVSAHQGRLAWPVCLAVGVLATSQGTAAARLSDANIHAAARGWVANATLAARTYGAIAGWDTARVTSMDGLFAGAPAGFNADLSAWRVSNVTSMRRMFLGAPGFNQPLAGWDVAAVADMGSMFEGAASFDQCVSTWTVGRVANMTGMFKGASAFGQDVSAWDISRLQARPSAAGTMFAGTRLSNCSRAAINASFAAQGQDQAGGVFTLPHHLAGPALVRCAAPSNASACGGRGGGQTMASTAASAAATSVAANASTLASRGVAAVSTAAATQAPRTQGQGMSGWSTGDKVGLVVGCVVLVFALFVVIVYFHPENSKRGKVGVANDGGPVFEDAFDPFLARTQMSLKRKAAKTALPPLRASHSLISVASSQSQLSDTMPSPQLKDKVARNMAHRSTLVSVGDDNGDDTYNPAAASMPGSPEYRQVQRIKPTKLLQNQTLKMTPQQRRERLGLDERQQRQRFGPPK